MAKARAGRKTRQGVDRYANGRIMNRARGETPQQITATARAQREKFFGAKESNWDMPLMGFVVGRLYLQKAIDARQMSAARVFTIRAVRYFQKIGAGLPKFPSIAAEAVASGIACSPDPDDDTIASIRSAYREVQDALADCGHLFSGNKLLMKVCIMDREPSDMVEKREMIAALNAIANRLRL